MQPTIQKKKYLSNLALIAFTLFVISAVIFSNLFKTSEFNSNNIAKNLKLFTPNEIININKVVLKNKSGEYTFEKDISNQVAPWMMTNPRPITANSSFFEKLNNLLLKSNIKKLYSNDKINNQNYSLDKPICTIQLISNNQPKYQIEIGLLNTIDNSIYLKTNKKNAIIHLDSTNINFEKLNLLDLIESQIFNFDLEIVNSIKIFKNKKNSEPIFEVTKIQNDWFNKKNEKIDSSKFEDFIQDLSLIKSSFILDKQTDVQKRQITSLKKNPEYIFTIEDVNKNNIDYYITGIVHDISDIDQKGESHFLISISNSPTVYLVKKDNLELFNVKDNRFIETKN